MEAEKIEFTSQPDFKKLVEESEKFDNIMAYSDEIQKAQKIMNYEYPHQAATELSSIQTPSQVKKRSYEKQLQVGEIQPVSYTHLNSPEVGSVHEELTALSKEGNDLAISFNPEYLIDALKVIKAPEVRIRFISNVRPFTLQPRNEESGFVQLITPCLLYTSSASILFKTSHFFKDHIGPIIKSRGASPVKR